MPAFVKLGDIKASSTNHVVVQSESLILPTDGDDILVVKPEANDVLTGLDVGPVNKLADNGWWTVDGANFRDTQQDAQPEKESFGSFEPREAKLQEASTNDQLIGGKALKWSELCDVGLSLRKADDFIKLGDIKGEYQVNEFPGDLVTGQEISDGSLAYAGSLSGEGVFKPQNIDEKGSVIFGDNHFRTGDGDSLTGIGSNGLNNMTARGDLALGVRGPLSIVQQDGQTFYKGPGGQLLGPLGGEGVFKPQNIDEKGSVIFGDNHFRTGEGGDSLTGGGRSIGIWTNGGASTFNANDTVVFETGLPVDGLHDSVHCVSDTPCLGGKTHLTETYEPIAEMYSFGESLNPALEIGGTAGPGGTSFMTGNIGIPTNIIGSSASPGGDYI